MSRELLSVEEGRKLGGFAVDAVSVCLSERFGVPKSVHASNVRSFTRSQHTTAIYCQGVVSGKELESGQKMFLVESAAPLLGFYNQGFDEVGTPILVAAYGRPELVRAWNVTVGPWASVISMPSVFHYKDMVLYIDSNYEPEKTSSTETA